MIGLRRWPMVRRLHDYSHGPMPFPQILKSIQHSPSNCSSRCSFSITATLRYRSISPDQPASAPNSSPTSSLENPKPESLQKNENARYHETPKGDALLREQTVSNKEQRKADWAIMKEMSRYLWPKVWRTKYPVHAQRLMLYKG